MCPILKPGEIKSVSVRHKQKILRWNHSIARLSFDHFLEAMAKNPEPERQKIPISLSSDGEDNRKNKVIYRELREICFV
jgi:hypothetical protein